MVFFFVRISPNSDENDLSFAVAELEALLAERGLALDYQLFHQTDQVKTFTRHTRQTR